MTSLPLNGLLQFGVNLEIAAKNSTVRKRVKSRSPKQDGTGENHTSGMVPRISAVPYEVEDLNDDHNGESQFSKTLAEDENGDFSESVSLSGSKHKLNVCHYGTTKGHDIDSRHDTIMNGDVPYNESSDQFVPLLEEQRHDEFETEIAGSGESSLEEGSFSIGLQIFFPFLVAGFGTVAAGILLDVVQVSNKCTKISKELSSSSTREEYDALLS